MIVSEIFELEKNESLTKNDIEKFIKGKKIKPVKWSIVQISEKKIKFLVSFEKKAL